MELSGSPGRIAKGRSEGDRPNDIFTDLGAILEMESNLKRNVVGQLLGDAAAAPGRSVYSWALKINCIPVHSRWPR